MRRGQRSTGHGDSSEAQSREALGVRRHGCTEATEPPSGLHQEDFGWSVLRELRAQQMGARTGQSHSPHGTQIAAAGRSEPRTNGGGSSEPETPSPAVSLGPPAVGTVAMQTLQGPRHSKTHLQPQAPWKGHAWWHCLFTVPSRGPPGCAEEHQPPLLADKMKPWVSAFIWRRCHSRPPRKRDNST